MARALVPAVEIQHRNYGYLKAIFAVGSTKTMTEKDLGEHKDKIFRTIIRLTIKSKPVGADVKANGMDIGTTIIGEKPFESGKEYVFLFSLKGFKADRRTFFVLPYPVKQEMEQESWGLA